MKTISRLEKTGLQVMGVAKDSIAEELGIERGDLLFAINGQPLRDQIDYMFQEADNYLEVLLEKTDGEQWLLEIEKDYGQPLGIESGQIVFDRLKRCNNHCIFCFVDQMPGQMRKTLHIKDDDFRFSFLQGSYITLNNLTDMELERIVSQRLSPLYISVHTTNPELRTMMMGNPIAGQIMSRLKFLAEAGIAFHAQAVLCPEVNDGQELERTIKDLATLYPSFRSLALVPVGLTSHREKLHPLRKFRASEAQDVIQTCNRWQARFLAETGSRVVFPSDEFFFLAGEQIPEDGYYEDYPQLENGVGLTRKFRKVVKEGLPVKRAVQTGLPEEQWPCYLVTGTLGALALEPVCSLVADAFSFRINILPQKNTFFGEEVTVAGLLTGRDVRIALAKVAAKLEGTAADTATVLLPAVCFNEQDRFLDDLALEELEQEFSNLDIKVLAGAAGFLEFIGDNIAGGNRR
ncbi:MAG: DUF512 domain-containing protein [Halanaerobium sp.]|nr:DUF512 domain-containing protein [Halanaerobium sp.]